MIEFLLLASWTTAQKPCSKRVTGKATSLFDSYCHSIDPSKMCINRPYWRSYCELLTVAELGCES